MRLTTGFYGILCAVGGKDWRCVYQFLEGVRQSIFMHAVVKHLCIPEDLEDFCVSLDPLYIVCESVLLSRKASKHYPRELARDNHHIGRVRVQLFNSDGSPAVPEIESSEQPRKQ